MARVNPIFKSPLINNPIRNGGASYFPPSNPKPKVVSIPVHFVGSETNKKKKIDPSIAAINIQRIFRGFLVRKNARIVREIEAEVNEIEKKFGADRDMDSIVGDAKERLKINEMLMRLLFRLDSVRGVRDYRKRVIRRVILIQEMLDSISTAESDDRKRLEDESKDGTLEAPQIEKPNQEMADSILAVESDDRNLESGDQMMESKEQLKVDAEIGEAKTLGQGKPDQEMVDSIPTVNQDLETGESKEKLKLDTEIGEAETLETNADLEMIGSIATVDQNLKTGDQGLGAIKVDETLETKPDQEMADSISTIESADQNLELVDSMEIPQDSKPEVENAEVKTVEHDDQALKTEDSKPENEDQISTGWELLETKDTNDLSPADQESVIVEEEENKKDVTKEPKKENLEEMMERMVVENEKLKGMVVELCQRSAQQCRLMGGLAKRLEHLEKIVQMMEKKTKKRRKESGSLPASTVNKNCGGNRTS